MLSPRTISHRRSLQRALPFKTNTLQLSDPKFIDCLPFFNYVLVASSLVQNPRSQRRVVGITGRDIAMPMFLPVPFKFCEILIPFGIISFLPGIAMTPFFVIRQIDSYRFQSSLFVRVQRFFLELNFLSGYPRSQ